MKSIKRDCSTGVCNLLMNAFEKDPLIVSLFAGKCSRQYMTVFFKFLINKSQLLREQLVGESMDGRWVSVANVELPSIGKSVSLVQQLRFVFSALGLIFKIPGKSFLLINEYMKFTTSVRPKTPHHYLVFIGVDPKKQGQGYGRRALEYIHCLVDQDPLSAGIGLDTENPENVKYYQKFGYQLLAQKNIQGVTVYCMFRSKTSS